MSERVASSGWIDTQVDLAMDEWSRAAGRWAGSGPRYSIHEQKHREKAYDRAIDEVRRTCRKRAPDAEERLTRSFAHFGAEALDLRPQAIDLLTNGFLPIGKQLARWARRFDPSLGQVEITQAARNAWTACGMQPLFGAPLRLTPSILGYSLLYPYTDNYLDRRAVGHDDKARFSRRLRDRLRGSLHAADAHESKVWEMVRLIECEFSRAHHPEVFDALLAIHGAQEESLRQLDAHARLEERELLRISCAKGGSSVLADACLVRGSLDARESEFAFLWGVLLQLGDDLQDIREDLENGSDTLFTRAIHAGQTLDTLVEQLLNFAMMVSTRMDALAHGSEIHRDLLRMSWRSLIVMTVGEAHAWFTPAFLARMEPCSAFRFAFLRKRREKLAGERGLFERVFEMVVNSEDHTEHAIQPAPERASLAV
jgi:hypothetical protein